MLPNCSKDDHAEMHIAHRPRKSIERSTRTVVSQVVWPSDPIFIYQSHRWWRKKLLLVLLQVMEGEGCINIYNHFNLSAQSVDVHFRLPFLRVITCTKYPVGGASRAVPVGAGADMIARIDVHSFLLFLLHPIPGWPIPIVSLRSPVSYQVT